jgi:hypothetical protein
MKTAVCLLPVVPMRKEPSHRSEMVSQLLFGEYASLGEEKDDFVFVKCDYDGYEGWVQAKQLTAISADEKMQPSAYTSAFSVPVATNNSLMHVPYATPVFVQNDFAFAVNAISFTYLLQPQQTWKPKELQFSANALLAGFQPFLNAPYLWGGKSVYGIDCSGFAQQVFKLFGVKLLRDAYLQAEQGSEVSALADAKLGDLAFFQNEKGKVTHVGILLNDSKIVHASGQVRIDSIDKNGINNREDGTRTHVLHSIRRFF